MAMKNLQNCNASSASFLMIWRLAAVQPPVAFAVAFVVVVACFAVVFGAVATMHLQAATTSLACRPTIGVRVLRLGTE